MVISYPGILSPSGIAHRRLEVAVPVWQHLGRRMDVAVARAVPPVVDCRVGRVAGVSDDAEQLFRRKIEDREPVEHLAARNVQPIVAQLRRLPGARRAYFRAHDHGVDEPTAEAGMRPEVCDDGHPATCRAGAGRRQDSCRVDGWTATGPDAVSRIRQTGRGN